MTACSALFEPTVSSALQVGDCLRFGGTADRPEVTEVPCGGDESVFRVVATVAEAQLCPADVDSSYTQRNAISDESGTMCLDLDWSVGRCMSISADPGVDPRRVDCTDASAPHRQRATQVLAGVAAVDQCLSGQGYAYEERQFTVCVEDVR